MEPKEVLAVLASCIVEGKKKEEEPTVEELDVPETVKDALYELNTIWNKLRDCENSVKSSPSEWPLGTFWIGPMWRWMEGESVATLCSDYGIYEGNLIRTALKLANMLEEWRSMAGYCGHVDLLDKFNMAHELIQREAVIQDSLYLHL
jgi:superfamily II RNA helicase